MIVTLAGLEGHKVFAYETGFNYFVDHIKVRVLEPIVMSVTPNYGASPCNFNPYARDITFSFSHEIRGEYIYMADEPAGRAKQGESYQA